MEGILAINPSEAERTQNLPVHSKAIGITSARKPLKRIENIDAKSVGFDRGGLKQLNPLKNLQKGISKTPAPLTKSSKKTGTSKTTNKKNFATKSAIKIFTDTPKDNDDIEYMPHGDPEEKELPLPSYIHRVYSSKPKFGIIPPSYGVPKKELREFEDRLHEKVQEENEKFLASQTEHDEEDNLKSIIDSLSTTHFVCERDLLLEMDDSFSLETLDKELKEAGLALPDW